MLASITAFLGAIPAFISLCTTLWTFIQKKIQAHEQIALANKVAAAVSTASTTGNTSDLEAIFKTGG